MELDIYLNYRGNCEQAFRFYEQLLGGRITGVVRHSEQPNPNAAADWNEVLHARIELGKTVLMGADIPQSEPMRVPISRSPWTGRSWMLLHQPESRHARELLRLPWQASSYGDD